MLLPVVFTTTVAIVAAVFAAPSPTVAKSCLVVGSGPVGLTTALALSRLGFTVTCVERRAESAFESTKAYLYLLDRRGQRMTNLLDLTSKVAERAVSSLASQELREIMPSGQINVKALPVMDTKDTEKWWIPRSELLKVFQVAAAEAAPGVTVLYNASCAGIRRDPVDGRLHVQVAVAGGKEERDFSPDLLVGADGINSDVRRFLEESVDAAKHTPVTLGSPAAGLRYKMITLKHRFPLPAAPATPLPAPTPWWRLGRQPSPSAPAPAAAAPGAGAVSLSVPEDKYVYRSTTQTRTSRVNLGLLSVRGDAKRTANIIAVPDHTIWGLSQPDDVQRFLAEAFPQVDWATFVEDGEVARFAFATPGVFPKPQYVPSLTAVVGSQGVALAGDAAHAFPPDLGQGVNSGLDDAHALYECLRDAPTSSGVTDVATALQAYDRRRAPEAKAICEIMRFAYPYQVRLPCFWLSSSPHP